MPKDSSDLIKYLKVTSGETPYLIREPVEGVVHTDKIKILGEKNVVLYIFFNRFWVKWSLLWGQSFSTDFLH